LTDAISPDIELEASIKKTKSANCADCSELVENIKEEIRKRRAVITFSLEEAFKYIFENTPTGTKRVWKNYEDQDINDLFISTKKIF